MIFQFYIYNEDVIFNFLLYKFDGYEEKFSSFFICFLIDYREYEYVFVLIRNEIIKEFFYYYKVGKRKIRIWIFEWDEYVGKIKREKYKFFIFIKWLFDVVENIFKKIFYIFRVS